VRKEHVMGYESERSDSPLPECGDLRLRFSGYNLYMVKGGLVIHSYPGVSGKPLEGGTFDYSQGRQKQANAGPIPEGTYWIRPKELSPAGWFRSRESWGNYRITIHPFTTTETYGRGGFFIHGGTHAGSAGCINLHGDMDNFERDLLGEVQGFGDCKVLLDVEYAHPLPPGDYNLPKGGTKYA
jgi:hypothetical protein